jgi:hypothetical protein
LIQFGTFLHHHKIGLRLPDLDFCDKNKSQMLDNIHHKLNNEHNMTVDIDVTAYKDIDIPIDIAADMNVDVTAHIAGG